MSNRRRTPRQRHISPHSGEGRQLGLDDREIPGGLEHLVSQETPVSKVHVPARPHVPPINEHGVPDADPDKPYELPEGELTVTVPAPVQVKPEELAVPVYQVERPGKLKVIRKLMSGGPMTIQPGAYQRIADRDPERVKLYVSNEAAAANVIRVCGTESEAEQGQGLAMFGSVTRDFVTQDAIWIYNAATAAVTVSWAVESEVPATF